VKRARDRQLRDREEKMLALAVVVVCAIAVSAMAGQLPHRAGLIGAAAAVPATTTTPASPTSPRPLPLAAVDLHITLWPHGPASASRSWRITCPGTGCAAARARSHDLITEPTGTCGPGNNGAGEALIIGRMGRHLVDDWLDHRDSCNVARWHTLQRVLRPPVR
jgi:hypothetical protein